MELADRIKLLGIHRWNKIQSYLVHKVFCLPFMFIPTHLYLLAHTLRAAQFNEVDLVPCEVRLDKEQDYAASCDVQYQVFGTQGWKIAMFGPIFLTTNFWLWPPRDELNSLLSPLPICDRVRRSFSTCRGSNRWH